MGYNVAKKILLLLSGITIALSISSCGVRGKLYLPNDPNHGKKAKKPIATTTPPTTSDTRNIGPADATKPKNSVDYILTPDSQK